MAALHHSAVTKLVQGCHVLPLLAFCQSCSIHVPHCRSQGRCWDRKRVTAKMLMCHSCNGEQKLCNSSQVQALCAYLFKVQQAGGSPLCALQTKGEVLGRLRGVSVKMLMHHSRNSEQKQWDETLVLALSGMGRLFRAHLPLLVPMQAFPQVRLGPLCCTLARHHPL